MKKCFKHNDIRVQETLFAPINVIVKAKSGKMTSSN